MFRIVANTHKALFFYITEILCCQHKIILIIICIIKNCLFHRITSFYCVFLRFDFRFTRGELLDILNRFTSVIRKGVDDYNMIQEGDVIAVGVSGGKDSLVLLRTLANLRTFYPKSFELTAITVDSGFPDMDFSAVQELCRDISVPYTLIRTDIKEIIFDIRKEDNPCALCSKIRRGALNNAIKSQGISKLALGHHADDAVETFLMSLIFEGRINCFKPVTYLDRSDIWQIRPMIYAEEDRIESLCQNLKLPVVESSCPMNRESKRQAVKELIDRLQSDYPDIRRKIFGAMQRFPLDGWAVDK